MHIKQRQTYNLGVEAVELFRAGRDPSGPIDKYVGLLLDTIAEFDADPSNLELSVQLSAHYGNLELAYNDGFGGRPFVERELPDFNGGTVPSAGAVTEGQGNADNNPDNFNPKESLSHSRLLEWSRSGKVSSELQESLKNAGASHQNIRDGRGDYVFDSYESTIDKMPPGVTPEKFLRDMMRDLNGTVDNTGFNVINKFSRRGDGDPAVGDIYDIDILGPVNGSVILSEVADDHFIFTTIKTPTDTHPEHGSREFGFERNEDGSVTFYTRGASRPHDVLTDLFGDLPQATGWTRLMRGIEDSIKTAGGSVKPNSFHEERHDVSNEPDPPAPLEFFYKIQLARNDGDNFEI
jgi:hypothetical protein